MSQSLNLVKNKIQELPNNIEAEQSVIGSILLSNEIFDEISLFITSKNFYDPMHQKIFNAIENLIYKGMLANPITLKNHFENGFQTNQINIVFFGVISMFKPNKISPGLASTTFLRLSMDAA